MKYLPHEFFLPLRVDFFTFCLMFNHIWVVVIIYLKNSAFYSVNFHKQNSLVLHAWTPFKLAVIFSTAIYSGNQQHTNVIDWRQNRTIHPKSFNFLFVTPEIRRYFVINIFCINFHSGIQKWWTGCFIFCVVSFCNTIQL